MAQPATDFGPKAHLKFLFLMANDLQQIEQFYKTLSVTSEGEIENGYLCVNLGISIIYFKADYDIALIKEFAWQPGYEAASGNLTSWSLEYPEAGFKAAYSNLKKSKYNLLKPKPEWRRDSYWGLTVQDPMGNTMELYCLPAAKPNDTDWDD